ncbi:unnamed protein product [Meganyctiphanes norvegica]|uniref:C-type lectin domain-containing protein n=1 Tax=Meganyctiphanes norvegica TaxID=48144 RepID=A0AAV2R0L2_MEGNR
MAANNSISNTTDSINDAIDSDSNQCSIIINSATTTHNGMWTCKVLTRGQPLNSSKTITIGCPHGYHLASGSDQCYKMGCPKGFFTLPSTAQCFKFFNETKVSWEEANTTCQENGMELAKPYDAVTLRRYLVERYGHDSRAWIGAHADGKYIRWTRDGSYLTTSNPLWYNGEPGSDAKSNNCLYLLASDSNMKSYPNQPFVTHSCAYQYRPLCELVMD